MRLIITFIGISITIFFEFLKSTQIFYFKQNQTGAKWQEPHIVTLSLK